MLFDINYTFSYVINLIMDIIFQKHHLGLFSVCTLDLVFYCSVHLEGVNDAKSHSLISW